MRTFFAVIFFLFLSGCASTRAQMPPPSSTSIPLADLSEGCSAHSEIVKAELSEPSRGYPYSYRVYLPPCFSAEGEARYPVLYLIPGRLSSPVSWLTAGLPE